MRIQEPVVDNNLVKQIKKELNLSNDIVSFLVGRGYDKRTIDLLTNNEYEDMNDNYILTNIKESCDKIWEYINDCTDIYIYNDYDSDGINAGYILYDCLSRLVLLQGSDCKIDMHTPNRCEGYGLNMEFCKYVVNNMNRKTLVITVDNGITKKEEVEYLMSHSVDVIITDHHKPQKGLVPDCLVIDAHLNDTDNENALGLCGAAVAYKLCKYMLEDKLGDTEFHQIYIPYVAIATITDMMPVTQENIVYVKNGLCLLNDKEYKTMFNTEDEETNILNYYNEFKGYNITPKDIAFEFGPQLNSCGRMGNVDKAMDLLLETDKDEIVDMYNEVCHINERRKSLTNETIELVLDTVEDNPISVIRLVKNMQGIAGNVATHITNIKHVPTILFTDSNKKEITGSARSIPGLDLQYIFRTINTKLKMKFGGHELAAGVTIYKKDLDTFVELFNNVVIDMILSMQSLEETEEPVMLVDKILSVKDLGDKLINKYKGILYFNDLSEPVFCLKGVYIKDVRESKNNKNNIQFFFKDKTGENNKGIWCWKYGNTYKEAGSPTKVNLVFTLDKFNNMLCMDIKYMEPVE